MRRPQHTSRGERSPAVRGARGFEIKRIYAPCSASDGYRVLVDRLWPRGISRQRAALDAWLVDLAPSAVLRTGLHRDVNRWPEFARRLPP